MEKDSTLEIDIFLIEKLPSELPYCYFYMSSCINDIKTIIIRNLLKYNYLRQWQILKDKEKRTSFGLNSLTTTWKTEESFGNLNRKNMKISMNYLP